MPPCTKWNPERKYENKGSFESLPRLQWAGCVYIAFQLIELNSLSAANSAAVSVLGFAWVTACFNQHWWFKMTDDITMASLKINNATSISPTSATPESKRPKYFSMASCYEAPSNEWEMQAQVFQSSSSKDGWWVLQEHCKTFVEIVRKTRAEKSID